MQIKISGTYTCEVFVILKWKQAFETTSSGSVDSNAGMAGNAACQSPIVAANEMNSDRCSS